MSDLPNYIPGIPPIYGLKQPAAEFAQGNDIVINLELNFNDQPINDPKHWLLEVFVKKSLKAQNILFRGTINAGLYQTAHNSNQYYFKIPGTISSVFLPGAYFYAVRGQQKPGSGENAIVTLATGMFDLGLDASSPNPKLTSIMSRVLVFDPTDLTFTITTESTEPTEPEIQNSLITVVSGSGGTFSPSSSSGTAVINNSSSSNNMQLGTNDPEGVITAAPGALYYNSTNNSLWIKETGTGSTGWVQLI